jgi:hypothetical protein
VTVSNGRRPGWDDANEWWPAGCQSCVRHDVIAMGGGKLAARTEVVVMGSYISNRNVCAQTWNLFNDDRCTLPENWTRML